jgi:hypothetical protein
MMQPCQSDSDELKTRMEYNLDSHQAVTQRFGINIKIFRTKHTYLYFCLPNL